MIHRIDCGTIEVNRAELQRLAEERVLDAEVLLKEKRWSAAYYLAGYAVECGLKSCVLVYIENTGIIFQDRKFAGNCWTHDIEELVKLAGLERERGVDVSANSDLGTNWLIVKDWNEVARYQGWTEPEVRSLYNAVADRTERGIPMDQGTLVMEEKDAGKSYRADERIATG